MAVKWPPAEDRLFDAVLQGAYKAFPLYSTSFFPLAYEALGKLFPVTYDQKIRALMAQADDGYVGNHVAATFHLVHYYRWLDQPTPKARQILQRVR
ncbi:MAG: hypothetical protein ACK4RK_02685 [Gemmataceae bacterium]